MVPKSTFYILRCGDFVKIGSTKRGLKQRLKPYYTHNPYPLEIVKTLHFDTSGRAKDVERATHTELYRHRIRNGSSREWYEASVETALTALSDALADMAAHGL